MKVFKLIFLALIIVSLIFIKVYADTESDKKSSEKCIDCHSNTIQFNEWQASRHANSLKTIIDVPKASTICLKCHSSDYNNYIQNNMWGAKPTPPTPKTAKNPISCSSCHRHNSGIKHNLSMPIDKLCVSCHTFDCG